VSAIEGMSMKSNPQLHRRTRSAFTLIEIMISIALAMILIAGIVRVFGITGDTISQGQALSEMTRSHRNVESTMRTDFEGIHNDTGLSGMMPANYQPSIIIDAQQVFAFLNEADQAGDSDGNVATFDANDDGNDTDAATVHEPSRRSHRIDSLSFFTRGEFKRQTGQVGPGSFSAFVYEMESHASEAWIWYGHAAIPGSNGTTYLPGDPSSSNDNNRFARQFRLARNAILLAVYNPLDNSLMDYRPQPDRPYVHIARTGANTLSPLARDSEVGIMVGGTFSPYYGGARAWQSFVDFAAISSSGNSFAAEFLPIVDSHSPADVLAAMSWRPLVQPYPDKPMTAHKAAQMAPIIQEGCTQFIVEFAGNFCGQDPNTGAVSGTDSDIDFTIQTINGRTLRSIRWYGLPRDIDGDGIINPAMDVVPVSAFTGNPFAPEVMTTANAYRLVWRATELATTPPAMIRITATFIDANGRNPDGMTREYIFHVPAN
jgi:type II secretory pathway pseudopilin PulG